MKIFEFFLEFLFPPGYFMILNTILKVPGPPGRLNKPKNQFFKKSQNFQKIAKNIKNIPFWGPLKRAPPALWGHLGRHIANRCRCASPKHPPSAKSASLCGCAQSPKVASGSPHRVIWLGASATKII